MRQRTGFTFIEILIVMIIAGIVLAMAMPRLGTATSRSDVRSAKREVAAYLSRARATAIQQGREARFVVDGNNIRVIVDNGDGTWAIAADYNVSAETGATLQASRNVVRFDPRGLAIGNTPFATIVATKNGFRDSVCVIGLGKIDSDQCSLAN
ncbi:MAG TPA: GspH/FimT family pseudopilin [Gemmatimonadaceae bacterium]